MNRKVIPVSELRHGDVIIGDPTQTPTVVTGVASFDSGSVPDLHVFGDGGTLAFTAIPGEAVTVVRCDHPVIYTELRFLQRGSLILIDPDEPLGLDYNPKAELVEYRVRDFKEKRVHHIAHIEVMAVPVRDPYGPTAVFEDVLTFPVRLVSCPECVVLEGERDAALALVDGMGQDGASGKHLRAVGL